MYGWRTINGLAILVIAGEGWKNAEGSYEGARGQHRGRGTKSDIVQSSEHQVTLCRVQLEAS
jgi:hypothetical protein